MNYPRSVLFQVVLPFAIFYANEVKSQQHFLKLDKKEVDFGKIASVNYAPKTVEFENTGSGKLAILLIEKSRDVKVQFERRFYAPGEKGVIILAYEPRNTGDFQETIYIHTNLDEIPNSLSVKGSTVSILECFPDPGNLLKRSVEVIDRYSKAPVPEAELILVHNHKFNNPVKVKVDKEGKSVGEMPIGLYHITAEADNYEQLETEVYVPKSQPYVILELTPLRKAPEAPVPSAMPEPRSVPAENAPAITITSAEMPEDQYAANNLIFLLDVSTSMKSGKKFLLLQQSVNNLAMILRPIDNVSVITYSNEANVVLTGISGDDKEQILTTVQELQPYGITRGVKGLSKAYDLAQQNFIQGGNNQIILMTDGEFSEKGLSDEYYTGMISGKASNGVKLSILGFGINKDAIARMKLMCRAGEGSFILVKSDEFVKDILIAEVKQKSFIGEQK